MTKLPAPLRILVDFREASCGAKKDMLPRMSEQGDDRALFELEVLRDTECPRRADPCCFKDNKALGNAIRTMKSRLAGAPGSTHSP
jgi:serine/threonine-protein kinase